MHPRTHAHTVRESRSTQGKVAMENKQTSIQVEKEKEDAVKNKYSLLDVVFIQLTVHSTDAHVLHHLNTTESCNTSS